MSDQQRVSEAAVEAVAELLWDRDQRDRHARVLCASPTAWADACIIEDDVEEDVDVRGPYRERARDYLATALPSIHSDLLDQLRKEAESPEAAVEAAEQHVSRVLERGFELYDLTGERLRFAPDSALARCAATAALQAALPAAKAAWEAEHNEEAADFSTELEDLASSVMPGGPQPDYQAISESLSRIACELAALSPTQLLDQLVGGDAELEFERLFREEFNSDGGYSDLDAALVAGLYVSFVSDRVGPAKGMCGICRNEHSPGPCRVSEQCGGEGAMRESGGKLGRDCPGCDECPDRVGHHKEDCLGCPRCTERERGGLGAGERDALSNRIIEAVYWLEEAGNVEAALDALHDRERVPPSGAGEQVGRDRIRETLEELRDDDEALGRIARAINTATVSDAPRHPRAVAAVDAVFAYLVAESPSVGLGAGEQVEAEPTAAEMLAEFHALFNYERTADPSLRLKLHQEEHEELVEALEEGELEAIARELADVVYVAYGSAWSLGIDLDAALREVHRANLSKLDDEGKPVYREDGKVLKGPNFRPPDLRLALEGHPVTIDQERGGMFLAESPSGAGEGS